LGPFNLYLCISCDCKCVCVQERVCAYVFAHVYVCVCCVCEQVLMRQNRDISVRSFRVPASANEGTRKARH